MDHAAFVDSLLSRTAADIAAEVTSVTAAEREAICRETLRRLGAGELPARTSMVILRATGVEPIVPALVELLRSDAAALDARAAALALLRESGFDVMTELKAIDPDAAIDIAAEAVLLEDEQGTLLDALDRVDPDEGRDPG